LQLLKALHAWRVQDGLNFDVISFSGYPLKLLRQRHSKILALLDAVIPEPFIEGQPTQKPWRGSDNQPLVPLSPRGLALYTPEVVARAATGSKSMQVAVEGGKVWMIGIPERGDMAQLESLCQSRGLNLEQVSWRR
jgi:anaerobic ribonucleoside-triphosphate reductase activating protein